MICHMYNRLGIIILRMLTLKKNGKTQLNFAVLSDVKTVDIVVFASLGEKILAISEFKAFGNSEILNNSVIASVSEAISCKFINITRLPCPHFVRPRNDTVISAQRIILQAKYYFSLLFVTIN